MRHSVTRFNKLMMIGILSGEANRDPGQLSLWTNEQRQERSCFFPGGVIA
jgi:hypothetical protein